MPGTMSQADLVADLKLSLGDAAARLAPPDGSDDVPFQRCLDHAAADLHRAAPRPAQTATLSLVSGQPNYAAPADLLTVFGSDWGRVQMACRNPWDDDWYPLPRLTLREAAGTRELWIDPPPTAAQVTDLGASYRYQYAAAHSIGVAAENTTVPAAQRGLLLLRAQAEAMKELSLGHNSKPVTLRDGASNGPRNGTPTALYEQLMKAFLDYHAPG